MSTVRLERPVHYGNTGLAFNENYPIDDPYIFKPENTRDVWSHARQIADRYGYDFRADESGDFVLRTRNNPHVVVDLAVEDYAGGSPTEKYDPSAYAGTYIETTGTVPSFTTRVTAARIDIVCPRKPALADWTFSVTRVSDSVVVSSGTISPADASAPAAGTFFYDFRSTVDGTNSTVATLYTGYYDEYDITLSGGTAGTRWLDCFQLWHTDPANPLLGGALKTEQNALTIGTESTADEVRNFVIVVGRRRAVVTDSAKLDTNPENPANEFVVAAGVDKYSVADPTANNFFGFTRESIIYDSGITDDDFAQYLARVFIYRQRLPRPNATITHTLLPCLQLRDAVLVEDSTYHSIDGDTGVLWVSGISHRVSDDEATTTIRTTSYQEFPSYEIREDIDLAKFNYQPVVNVDVTYTSLTGQAQTNLGGGLAHINDRVGDLVTTAPLVASSDVSLAGYPWPPVPGTMFVAPTLEVGGGASALDSFTIAPATVHENGQLGTTTTLYASTTVLQTVQILSYSTTGALSDVWTITQDAQTSRQFYYQWNPNTRQISIFRNNVKAGTASTVFGAVVTYWVNLGSTSNTGWMGNTPYHHFTEIDYAGQSVRLPWKQGDNRPAYDLLSSTVQFHYRALDSSTPFEDPYDGNAPFYDPYTSELGYLVNVDFDALVSGLYRISVRSYYDDTIVAWLTEPTQDAQNEESHWQYFTAGRGKSLAWDGVDQVGTWNRKQSQEYADANRGNYDVAERPLVGSGFYVWNREVKVQDGFPIQALISGDMTAGKPDFGIGTYAEWYIRFEVKSDQLEEEHDADRTNPKKTYPRVVDTGSRWRRLNQTGLDEDAYEARIYTHLPAPTNVGLTIHDWVGGVYDESDDSAINNDANWSTAPNAEATLNNQQPVRVRFTVQPRPGTLWAGNEDEVTVKMTRHVHLRVNLMDQFIVFEGQNYVPDDEDDPIVENRRVVSRRLTNDDHTITFVDDGYRKARSFKQAGDNVGTEWIFRPDDFRKDFRGIPNEAVVFGDYLQLEEVPRWDTERAIAGSRSRLQIAFMAYLFYLSAYVQDRSGRFSWGLNTSFVDQTKIIANAASDWEGTPTHWPDDQTTQSRRTVVCRQWQDEQVDGLSYEDYLVAKWGFGNVGRALTRHAWEQHASGSTSIGRLAGGSDRFTWAGLAGSLFTDDYTGWHTDEGELPFGFTVRNRQLGKGASSALGTWGFETSPSFPPCVTRDFHGYHLVPPMPDMPLTAYGANQPYLENYIYLVVDYRVPQLYQGGPDLIGNDAAAATVWNSPIRDDTETPGDDKRFWPGRVVTAGKDPTKNLTANTLDYQRQDTLVHYEELRGVFSRGPRPQEAPRKVQPGLPYYQNVFRYGAVAAEASKGTQYPLYRVQVENWFDMSFRHEYVWESATLFPCTTYGLEQLDGVNPRLAQILNARQLGSLRVDGGAWTGWKDDGTATGIIVTTSDENHDSGDNVFKTGFMPFAVGPRLSTVHDMLFTISLPDERRTSSGL